MEKQYYFKKYGPNFITIFFALIRSIFVGGVFYIALGQTLNFPEDTIIQIASTVLISLLSLYTSLVADLFVIVLTIDGQLLIKKFNLVTTKLIINDYLWSSNSKDPLTECSGKQNLYYFSKYDEDPDEFCINCSHLSKRNYQELLMYTNSYTQNLHPTDNF